MNKMIENISHRLAGRKVPNPKMTTLDVGHKTAQSVTSPIHQQVEFSVEWRSVFEVPEDRLESHIEDAKKKFIMYLAEDIYGDVREDLLEIYKYVNEYYYDTDLNEMIDKLIFKMRGVR